MSAASDILLAGLSHRTATVSVRERMVFCREVLAPALARLCRLPGVGEGLILSTCNRTEVLARATDPAAAAGTLRTFLREESGLAPKELDDCLYTLSGLDAVRHMFRVAASLDSQIVGEPQILHQVKAAHAVALQEGAAGPVLDALCQRAFAAARRVRRETGIGRHSVSIAYAAAELARTIFGDLAGHALLVIGAGRMAELAVRHLRSAGATPVFVCSRTHAHAATLSERVGGEPVPFERLAEYLARVDIVVSSTAAPRYILGAPEVAALIRKRRNRPIFFIDIALPRDIDPAVNDIDNVYLYDLDDLEGVVEENREERRREAARAEAIVDEAVALFRGWHLGLAAGPTIVALRTALHELRRRELLRFAARSSGFTAEQATAVDEFSRLLINKILHGPVSALKRLAGREALSGQVETVRCLFGLDGTPAGPGDRAAVRGETADADADSGTAGDAAPRGEHRLGAGRVPRA